MSTSEGTEGDRAADAGRAEVRVVEVDPASPAADSCLRAYYAELDRRFDAGFDPERTLPAAAAEMRPPAGTFLVAMLGDEPVGCAGLKFPAPAVAECKRMWVDARVRGTGLGRRLLDAVTERARAAGSTTLRLDTNRNLGEAIAMYRSNGFVEVPAFNDEPYDHHWFARDLTS